LKKQETQDTLFQTRLINFFVVFSMLLFFPSFLFTLVTLY